MTSTLKRILLSVVGMSAYRALARRRDGLSGYLRLSYSQFGEDVFLLNRFAETDAGFYVDIGAHHPSRFSNTCLLYQRGWHGVNIDPIPGMKRTFDRARPRDINVEAAIAARPGKLRYFQFDEPTCNTFSEHEAASRQSEGVRLLGVVEVRAVPLAEILAETVPAAVRARGIDLLNVDVEGMDLEILQAFDFAGYRPRMVCVEDHHFDGSRPEQSVICRHLAAAGYRLCAWMGPTLVFEREGRRRPPLTDAGRGGVLRPTS